VAFATQDRASHFWLEGDLVVLAAVVTDYLEALGGILPLARFFRTALCTPLRRHHVALVKDLLFLFSEKERFFALNASGLDVRHILFFSLISERGRWRTF
jgi:hypothetical protein